MWRLFYFAIFNVTAGDTIYILGGALMATVDEEFKQKIRKRLVRMETKLDNYNEIKSKAYDALNRSINCEKDICEMKDDQKWMRRTIIASMFGAIIAVVGSLIAIVVK